MTDRDRFYEERDRRTREFGVTDIFDKPVGVVVGVDAAQSHNGQLAVLALVNMLARMHRHLCLRVPPVPLLGASLVPATRLDEAAFQLAQTIDPFIRFDSAVPPHAIALGADVTGVAPWYVGAEGQVAVIDQRPLRFPAADRVNLGSALAVCLAAANLLRQVQGRCPRPVRLSAWDSCEGQIAGQGPERIGPLDVGSVLQIGAGGVGNCLDYWLWVFGVIGDWRVVDRDLAALHNTNRCLGLLPRHAGWPVGPPMNKAESSAALFGGRAEPVWYHEFDQEGFRPDIVLPLANEYSVRHFVACRGEAIVLHATTSRLGEAQFHRHIAGQDDCIVCRMPNRATHPAFSCGTAPAVSVGGPSADAALPFLSAAAGLALLSGLFRLQHGELGKGRHNLWAICFGDERRHGRRAVHRCQEECTATLPRGARLKIHRGRRWSHLDSAIR
jgi:hypothetical protein